VRPAGVGDRLGDAPTSTFRATGLAAAGAGGFSTSSGGAGFGERGNTFDSGRPVTTIAPSDPNVGARGGSDAPHLEKANEANVTAAADRLTRAESALATALSTARPAPAAAEPTADAWPWRRRSLYAITVGGGLLLLGLVLLAAAGPLWGGIAIGLGLIAVVTFLTFPFSALGTSTVAPATAPLHDLSSLQAAVQDARQQLSSALRAVGRTDFADPRVEHARYVAEIGRTSRQDHRPLDQLRGELDQANREYAEAAEGLYPSEIQGADPDSLSGRMNDVTMASNRYDAATAALAQTQNELDGLLQPDPEAAATAAKDLCDRLRRAQKTLEEAAEGLRRAQLTAVQGLVAGINARLAGQIRGIINDRMIDVRVRDGLRLDIRESMRRGQRRGSGSHSTRQLSYAFAKIALGQHVTDASNLTALPLLVDDILSGSDAGRISQVMRILGSIAQQGRQVVVFTQNPTAKDWAVAEHRAGRPIHIVRLQSVDHKPAVYIPEPLENPPAPQPSPSQQTVLNNLSEHFVAHTYPDSTHD
jgi:hypothetical protein